MDNASRNAFVISLEITGREQLEAFKKDVTDLNATLGKDALNISEKSAKIPGKALSELNRIYGMASSGVKGWEKKLSEWEAAHGKYKKIIDSARKGAGFNVPGEKGDLGGYGGIAANINKMAASLKLANSQFRQLSSIVNNVTRKLSSGVNALNRSLATTNDLLHQMAIMNSRYLKSVGVKTPEFDLAELRKRKNTGFARLSRYDNLHTYENELKTEERLSRERTARSVRENRLQSIPTPRITRSYQIETSTTPRFKVVGPSTRTTASAPFTSINAQSIAATLMSPVQRQSSAAIVSTERVANAAIAAMAKNAASTSGPSSGKVIRLSDKAVSEAGNIVLSGTGSGKISLSQKELTEVQKLFRGSGSSIEKMSTKDFSAKFGKYFTPEYKTELDAELAKSGANLKNYVPRAVKEILATFPAGARRDVREALIQYGGAGEIFFGKTGGDVGSVFKNIKTAIDSYTATLQSTIDASGAAISGLRVAPKLSDGVERISLRNLNEIYAIGGKSRRQIKTVYDSKTGLEKGDYVRDLPWLGKVDRKMFEMLRERDPQSFEKIMRMADQRAESMMPASAGRFMRAIDNSFKRNKVSKVLAEESLYDGTNMIRYGQQVGSDNLWRKTKRQIASGMTGECDDGLMASGSSLDNELVASYRELLGRLRSVSNVFGKLVNLSDRIGVDKYTPQDAYRIAARYEKDLISQRLRTKPWSRYALSAPDKASVEYSVSKTDAMLAKLANSWSGNSRPPATRLQWNEYARSIGMYAAKPRFREALTSAPSTQFNDYVSRLGYGRDDIIARAISPKLSLNPIQRLLSTLQVMGGGAYSPRRLIEQKEYPIVKYADGVYRAPGVAGLLPKNATPDPMSVIKSVYGAGMSGLPVSAMEKLGALTAIGKVRSALSSLDSSSGGSASPGSIRAAFSRLSEIENIIRAINASPRVSVDGQRIRAAFARLSEAEAAARRGAVPPAAGGGAGGGGGVPTLASFANPENYPYYSGSKTIDPFLLSAAGTSRSGGLSGAMRRVALWGAGASIIYGGVAQTKNLIQEAKEIETSMAEIEKVMPATANLNKLEKGFWDFANGYGQAMKSVIEVGKVFSQQGLDEQRVLSATETAMIGMNAVGFEHADAVEYLTGLYKTWNLEMNQTPRFMSKLMSVAKRFPITAGELGQTSMALSPAIKAVGGSYDDMLGYVTAIKGTTRESIGRINTSLKMMLYRMYRTDASKALAGFGIGTRNQEGGLRKPGDIFGEIVSKRKSGEITDVGMFELASAIGGRHYKSVLALMDNYDEAMQARLVSEKASREAFRANDIQMQTTEKRWASATSILKEFAITLADLIALPGIQGLAKVFGSLGSGLEKVTELPFFGNIVGQFLPIMAMLGIGKKVGGFAMKNSLVNPMNYMAMGMSSGIGMDDLIKRLGVAGYSGQVIDEFVTELTTAGTAGGWIKSKGGRSIINAAVPGESFFKQWGPAAVFPAFGVNGASRLAAEKYSAAQLLNFIVHEGSLPITNEAFDVPRRRAVLYNTAGEMVNAGATNAPRRRFLGQTRGMFNLGFSQASGGYAAGQSASRGFASTAAFKGLSIIPGAIQKVVGALMGFLKIGGIAAIILGLVAALGKLKDWITRNDIDFKKVADWKSTSSVEFDKVLGKFGGERGTGPAGMAWMRQKDKVMDIAAAIGREEITNYDQLASKLTEISGAAFNVDEAKDAWIKMRNFLNDEVYAQYMQVADKIEERFSEKLLPKLSVQMSPYTESTVTNWQTQNAVKLDDWLRSKGKIGKFFAGVVGGKGGPVESQQRMGVVPGTYEGAVSRKYFGFMGLAKNFVSNWNPALADMDKDKTLAEYKRYREQILGFNKQYENIGSGSTPTYVAIKEMFQTDIGKAGFKTLYDEMSRDGGIFGGILNVETVEKAKLLAQDLGVEEKPTGDEVFDRLAKDASDTQKALMIMAKNLVYEQVNKKYTPKEYEAMLGAAKDLEEKVQAGVVPALDKLSDALSKARDLIYDAMNTFGLSMREAAIGREWSSRTGQPSAYRKDIYDDAKKAFMEIAGGGRARTAMQLASEKYYLSILRGETKGGNIDSGSLFKKVKMEGYSAEFQDAFEAMEEAPEGEKLDALQKHIRSKEGEIATLKAQISWLDKYGDEFINNLKSYMVAIGRWSASLESEVSGFAAIREAGSSLIDANTQLKTLVNYTASDERSNLNIRLKGIDQQRALELEEKRRKLVSESGDKGAQLPDYELAAFKIETARLKVIEQINTAVRLQGEYYNAVVQSADQGRGVVADTFGNVGNIYSQFYGGRQELADIAYEKAAVRRAGGPEAAIRLAELERQEGEVKRGRYNIVNELLGGFGDIYSKNLWSYITGMIPTSFGKVLMGPNYQLAKERNDLGVKIKQEAEDRLLTEMYQPQDQLVYLNAAQLEELRKLNITNSSMLKSMFPEEYAAMMASMPTSVLSAPMGGAGSVAGGAIVVGSVAAASVQERAAAIRAANNGVSAADQAISSKIKLDWKQIASVGGQIGGTLLGPAVFKGKTGEYAGTGANLGSMIGSATPLGPVGGLVGGLLGGVIGAALSPNLKEPLDKNTQAVINNTLALEDMTAMIVHGPATFQMGPTFGDVNYEAALNRAPSRG